MSIALLRPYGCPRGISSHDWRSALVERIDRQAAILSKLIDALDAMEGDADCEPWLGANEPTGSDIAQLHWSGGSTDNREDENEHGGDVQDEPHDTIDEGNSDYSCPDDLGTASHMNDADRDAAWDEGQRLVSQARAMLPLPVVLRFERPQQ